MEKNLRLLFVEMFLVFLMPSVSHGMIWKSFSKYITIEQGQIYELNFQGIDTYDVYIKYSSATDIDVGKWTNETNGCVRILKYGGDKWKYDPSYGNSRSTTCTILGVSSCNKAVIKHQLHYSQSGTEYLIDTKVYVTVLSTSNPKLTVSASPEPGDYKQSQTVKLSASQSGATIFYTTDGSIPYGYQTYYSSEKQYSYGITIGETTTLKAFAVKKGYPVSDVYTFQYNLGSSKIILTASLEGGQIPQGSRVYLKTNIPDAEIYYTEDGSTPNKSSRKYNSSGIGMYESCTLKAIAYKDGYITSDVLSIDYLVPYSFTANTTEGYEMEFEILDFSAKTCKVKKLVSKDVTGKVTIPATVEGYKVTEIGDWAFSSCKLSSVIIPDGVVTIQTAAFQSCDNLTSINMPSSVKRLENQAFADCKSLETITGINNLEYIGYSALVNIPWLKKLPDGPVYIGKVLFAYKGKMPSNTTINIKEGTKCIANTAFVWEPERNTWNHWRELVGVTIPASVTDIDGNPFENYYLNSLVVNENNPVFDSRNNCNAVIETSTNTLIAACNNTVIPSNVKVIGRAAFSYLKIKDITIPDGVDSLGQSAINNCSNLESLVIGKGVRAMAYKTYSADESNPKLKSNDAIVYNIRLKSIIVSSENPYFDSRNNCNAIIEKSTNALRVGCATTVIPISIVDICGEAFYGNGSEYLTSITIPDNVERIGAYAFWAQNNLESVVLGKGVKVFGIDVWGAFLGCGKLNTVISRNEFPSDINEKAFDSGIFDRATLYVPVGSQMNYLSAGGWYQFKSIREGEPPIFVTSVSLDITKVSMTVGDSKQLTATVKPDNATDKSVTWRSSDDNIAIVSNSGLVTAISDGDVTITCSANDGSNIYASCSVTVNKKTTPDPQPTLKGDVNEDEKVNGTDLVALTNIILGKNPEKASADVNGDTKVNGTDYVALANIILGKTASRRMKKAAEGTGLSIEEFSIKAGETKEMIIDLANSEDEITLVQFDLRLPAGLSLKQTGGEYDFDIAGRTTWRKHSLDANAQPDGSIRFLLASSSNTVLDGKEGAIIKMTLVADNSFAGGDIKLENILMVTPDEKEKTQDTYVYSVGSTQPQPETSSAVLAIEPFAISAGETKEMIIDLTNPEDEITLVQFDLRLPAGLSLKQTGGEYDFDIAGRTTWRKHSLDANAQADGSIRFLLASSSNTVLDGKEGAIIKMTLVADNSYRDDVIRLESILLVTPDEKEITPANVEYLPTGITDVVQDSSKHTSVFSLSGQRLAAPKKGINIVGGRKVVVK